jgi:hypothetical protein
MFSSSFLSVLRCPKVSTGLLVGVMVSAAVRAQPVITLQPVGVAAYETQTAQFTVEATGAVPLSFQWRAGGTNIPSGTNSVLSLGPLEFGQTGIYQVVITDAAGSVTSAPATLVVLPRPLPFLSFGVFVPGPTPEVPVQYTAFGTENRVRFSVAYNTNTLENPRFISSLTGPVQGDGADLRGARPSVDDPVGSGNATITTSHDSAGSFGVEVVLGGGSVFPPGLNALGRVEWDAREGAGAFVTGLVLTNTPTPIQAGPLSGTNGTVATLPIGPVFRVLDTPVLDYQSGLFLQRLELGNPGVRIQPQVRVSASGLGNDSQGNRIRMHNAMGTNATGEDAVLASGLEPGEQRRLRVEFYVSDLVTVPAPQYAADEINPAAPPSLSQKVLAVDNARFITNSAYPTGAFLVDFETQAGRPYFVQYADSVEAFSAGSAGIRTAQPAVLGTGSRVQWIDEGPPKTDSVPAAGARFYRIILGR